MTIEAFTDRVVEISAVRVGLPTPADTFGSGFTR